MKVNNEGMNEKISGKMQGAEVYSLNDQMKG